MLILRSMGQITDTQKGGQFLRMPCARGCITFVDNFTKVDQHKVQSLVSCDPRLIALSLHGPWHHWPTDEH
ncbi:MAG: hypothetical protein ACI807_003098 [Paracoccaceae bacterium]|jgi:hypothetical protein